MDEFTEYIRITKSVQGGLGWTIIAKGVDKKAIKRIATINAQMEQEFKGKED